MTDKATIIFRLRHAIDRVANNPGDEWFSGAHEDLMGWIAEDLDAFEARVRAEVAEEIARELTQKLATPALNGTQHWDSDVSGAPAWLITMAGNVARRHKGIQLRAAAGSSPDTTRRCCDLHNEHCEPPSELCCARCTEAAHDTFPVGHADGSACVLASDTTPTGHVCKCGLPRSKCTQCDERAQCGEDTCAAHSPDTTPEPQPLKVKLITSWLPFSVDAENHPFTDEQLAALVGHEDHQTGGAWSAFGWRSLACTTCDTTLWWVGTTREDS